MWQQGIRTETREVFERVSLLNCIKDLYLCGDTGISIQLPSRLSEDLDFELLNYHGEIKTLDTAGIVQEITTAFPNCKKEFLGTQHLQFYVDNNVKLSFFQPKNHVPELNKGLAYNNIQTVSLQDALGMKLFTLTVRNVFRDYYDIYALLMAGYSLKDGVNYALRLSRHEVKSKMLYSLLLNPALYRKDSNFSEMNPKYDVSPDEICDYIKDIIAQK